METLCKFVVKKPLFLFVKSFHQKLMVYINSIYYKAIVTYLSKGFLLMNEYSIVCLLMHTSYQVKIHVSILLHIIIIIMVVM